MSRPSGTFSGGPIEAFAAGWALIPFVGRLPHYWREQAIPPELTAPSAGAKAWRSLCEIDGFTSTTVPALAPGNVPLCKRCKHRLSASATD